MTARLLLVVSLAVASGTARAADFRGQVRLWAAPGFDSNARRDYVSSGSPTSADAFLGALGQAEGLLRLGERWTFRGGYDVGARKFVLIPSEDTIVQSARLEASLALTPSLALGVLGQARDRRGADRDYTDAQAGLAVDFAPGEHLALRASVTAHRFIYYRRFAYSHLGPDGTLTARYRFDRRHAVSAFGGLNPRVYESEAAARPGPDGSPTTTGETRRDTVMSAGVGYAYRGPFHLSATYAYVDQASNSFGETLRRHRLGLVAGVRLPWEVTALASGTLQLSSFPDGVYLSSDLTVVEDDENSSSVTLKLVRPVWQRLEVDVRYALYVNSLPQNGYLYLRHVASVGLAYSF